MLFNSYEFVFVFLPLVLALWWCPKLSVSARLTILVSASYLFYGWWDYRFVSLLMVSTLVDYHAGNYLAAAKTEAGRVAALLVSLAVNLGLLAFFKYSGFMASSVNAVLAALRGEGGLPVMDVVLPVGISFYTFQTLSYTIDIYRRQAKPADSILHFAAYVSMFPQLIAGPIVRYGELEDQLRRFRSRPDWELMSRGMFFFIAGLAQKLLLADTIASRVNPMFADYHSLQFVGSWFAMLGYTCQLYFDFAGYSNMAVGLGLMLGLQFPQNFDSPYKAENISTFWRRWHITLSSWLRDYLFIPLGGSQGGRWLTLRNLVIVMFLGGLWHGAGWTFVLWGLFHGLLLVLHRLSPARLRSALPKPVAVAITFVSVVLSWVLFRSLDLAMTQHLFAAMAGLHGIEAEWIGACGGLGAVIVLATLLFIIFLAPNVWQIRFRPTTAWAVALAATLFVCVLRLDVESPFLYFQF